MSLRTASDLSIQSYLDAGADFTETNTFNGTAVAQSDYGMEHLVSTDVPENSKFTICTCFGQVYRINKTAAEIANRACADVAKSTGMCVGVLSGVF